LDAACFDPVPIGRIDGLFGKRAIFNALNNQEVFSEAYISGKHCSNKNRQGARLGNGHGVDILHLQI
jgi:hypothetical protein